MKPSRPTDDESSAEPYQPGTATAFDALSRALEDRYTIERELGRGGASVVYLAREVAGDRLVALKVLRQELAAAVGVPRFLREIEIEGRLRHENILPIYDSGSVNDRPYYTMPYVDGETLRDRVNRERQLTLTAVVSIARSVAQALDHAHAHGVVHRDVKPANILLARDGSIFLADFGIARAMTVSTGDRLTDSGILVGTPEYMSPEQADPKPLLDARSDVYALGCVVYEMLGGEPPFTGPTTQAIVARHCQEAPRSLVVIRPTLGPAVQSVIECALAKVPADRYATPSQMVDALEAAFASGGATKVRRIRARTWWTAGIATIGIAAATFSMWPVADGLDANRTVVFPLRDSPSATGLTGEEIATYIGYALEGTRPLTWLEGWELLTPAERANADALTQARALQISRAAHAGFFIDGSILRSNDSTRVVLNLHSVAGDSIVKSTGASGTGPVPEIALRAISQLLPPLLAPNRRADLTALEQLHPNAVANFLQGEREYRRMQFSAAAEHYHEALRSDSSFALAALRGAEAANWDGRYGEDTAFAAVALRQTKFLPPVRALVARGLYAYLTGGADTAIVHLRRALEIDSSSAPVWTMLAEVYERMLPSVSDADSLARNALEHARRADREFAPALLLLEGRALREGRVTDALQLRDELRAAGADTTHQVMRDIMLRCVRNGASAVDWADAARRDARQLQFAGKVLSAGAAQTDCATRAFTAALQSDSAPRNLRWGTLVGLQSVLVATGRIREVPPLLASKQAADLPVWMLYALDIMAGADLRKEGEPEIEHAMAAYNTMKSTNLYVLAAWAAYRDDRSRFEAIDRELRRKADSSHSRVDSLLVRAIGARIPLLKGDTAEALRLLEALAPTAPRSELAWQPWEALGAERLLRAQILLLRGRFDDALRVAGMLDATEPIAYLLYLRPSLDIRFQAARAAGRNAQATIAERRLNKLGTQVH